MIQILTAPLSVVVESDMFIATCCFKTKRAVNIFQQCIDLLKSRGVDQVGKSWFEVRDYPVRLAAHKKEHAVELNSVSQQSSIKFLQLIYRKHSPVDPELQRTDAALSEGSKLRRNLLLASIAYHPDKNMNVDGTDAGELRFCLCLEIQKILTRLSAKVSK